MEKLTRHSIQWFYNLLAKGEGEMLDFKEQRKKKIEVMQTKKQLIINTLSVFSFASSFAKISTSTRLCNSFCLRMQSIITAFANENILYFNHLAFTRLHHRLQICQLSPSNSLQDQAALLVVCKEKNAYNQPINQTFFAGFFASNTNKI